MDSTDRQLDIMNILWDRGSATVREAKEEMVSSLTDVAEAAEERRGEPVPSE